MSLKINLDLHSHSFYAGGVGSLNIEDMLRYAPLKGIEVVGTGDCQFNPWLEILQKKLTEWNDSGLFVVKSAINNAFDRSTVKFLLQTEVIFTAAIPRTKKRKQSHTLLLFPTWDSVLKFYNLAYSWGTKLLNMARPFITCESPSDVGEKIKAIKNIDSLIEVIPAHIMTPDGIFGSNVKLNYLEDFYGEASSEINVIETGLSADPQILWLIPELDKVTFISNSDAHSAALNRTGREFTTLELTSSLNYSKIIDSLRKNHVTRTAEFHPSEGRYFFTGHRSGRNFSYKSSEHKLKNWHEKDEYCKFSPKYVPKDKKCPICHKDLTIGALQRAYEIGEVQGVNRDINDYPRTRSFIHMVPLIEVIIKALGLKSVNSKTAVKIYNDIVKIEQIKNECELWFLSIDKIRANLENIIDSRILNAIELIKNDNFYFIPGFDGFYGDLVLGQKIDFLDINEVIMHKK